MPYLLDANVFITGHNTHYGMGFCPGFWDWIEREHGNGKVFSIDKVEDELKERGDEISKWIDGLGSTFFLSTNKAVVSDMDFVIEWANKKEFKPSRIREFIESADYYLIVHAISLGYGVVTYETTSGSKRKVKIPSACEELGVGCMVPSDMLKRERARFVLAP